MLSRSVTELVQTLRYGDPADRRAALAELSQIAPGASEAIPDLIAILHDVDLSIRGAATDALARIGADAVPLLVEAMLEEDVDFRKAVIGTLGRIGPVAKAAVPVLKAAQSNPQLAADAEAALAQINPPLWARLRPHLVGTLPSAMLITGALIVGAGAITTLVWLAEQMHPGNPLALTIGTAIGLLGGFLGGVIGGTTHGRPGALLGLVLLGIAGYFIGVFIGGWVGWLLGPLGH